MSGDAAALARRILERAHALGFERAGVAPAEHSPRAAAFAAWLDGGMHGEMDYLARDPGVRSDPRVRDRWARSVVSVAMNYSPPSDGDEVRGRRSGIARYAAGMDYHPLLESRLRRLEAFVHEEAPGVMTRVAVDTQPFLERSIAESAGVGWLAKNTMIITPDLGSWTLLGELVTDLPLPQSSPIEDRCGSCTACLEACPTGAFTAPFVLDARRCISTWTIELRGAIPRESRADVADHLFGCDICQEVCPWNRKAPEAREPGLRPDPSITGMTTAKAARLDDAAFRGRFAKSAIRRAKRRGLVRNALIVGANTGDGEALAAAEDRLIDADPVVRGAAAWALGRGAGKRGRALLEAARSSETEAPVRDEIEAALAGA